MTVSSLFDLRGQLAAYLAPHLPGCEILYSMPTVRRPLTPGVTTLVMSDHSVKRSETALPGSTPLLLEVGLRLTVLHRESMEAAELLSGQLSALTARGGFPLRGGRANLGRDRLFAGVRGLWQAGPADGVLHAGRDPQRGG